MAATSRTPVTVLHEFCTRRGITPFYETDDDKSPTHMRKFICNVTCDNVIALGEGRSKNEAKHAAAKKMLQQIQNTNVPSPYEGKLKDDAVGPLLDFCNEYGMKAADYLHTRAEGPPHANMFTLRCNVESFSTEAIERTKQQAKQRAARKMLSRLRTIVDTHTKILPPGDSFIEPSKESDYKKAKSLLSNCDYADFRRIHSGNLTKPLMTDFVGNSLTNDSEVFDEITKLLSDYNEQNAVEKLTAVLEKLEMKYTLTPLETNHPERCAVIFSIDCSPNLDVHECGRTYIDACHNVAFKTLQFIEILFIDQKDQKEISPDDDFDFESFINARSS